MWAYKKMDLKYWKYGQNTGAHWVIGDKGSGHFLINKPNYDSGRQLLIRHDSKLFHKMAGNKQHHGAASANWRHHGKTNDNIQLGSWFIGQRDGNHFVISKGSTCQFLVRHDHMLWYTQKHGAASAGWRHTGPSANVLQFGDWLVGEKDANHFVISHIPSGTCTFLIRHDSRVFYTSDAGIA